MKNFIGKCMFAAAVLALTLPVLATAQDSAYRVSGATGTSHPAHTAIQPADQVTDGQPGWPRRPELSRRTDHAW